MKQVLLILLLVFSELFCSAQLSKRIDFRKEVGDSYIANKLISNKASLWRLNVDGLKRTNGYAMSSEEGSFDIKGLEGDFSFLLQKLSLEKNKQIGISLDINGLGSDKHYYCQTSYLYDKLSFQNISENFGTCTMQINYKLSNGYLELSVDFKNLKESDIFKITNIEVKNLDDEIIVEHRDTSSLFYAPSTITKFANIHASSKEKILSFYIEDIGSTKDSLPTIVNKLKIFNAKLNSIGLNIIFKNIEIYKDDILLTDVNKSINNDYIEIVFNNETLNIDTNKKCLIEIYADVNKYIDYGLKPDFSLLLTNDSFEMAEKSSLLKKEQSLYSPLTYILSPLIELSNIYENDFNHKSLVGLANSEKWKIDSLAINEANYDYYLRANATNLSDNSFSINMGELSLKTQDISWSFRLTNEDWNPTSYNKFCYILFSDINEFSSEISGYGVGVNMDKTDNLLCVYRIDKGEYFRIAESSFLWSENKSVDIRLLRKADSSWFLSYTDNINSLSYDKTIEFLDDTYLNALYSGLYFKYTTTRATKLYIDNIHIAIVGEYLVYLKDYCLGTKDQLSLFFSEHTDLSSLSSLNDYKLLLDNKEVNLESVNKVDGHIDIVFPLVSGDYRLVFLHPKDVDGNNISIDDIYFNYTTTESMGEVVINEIMVDPISPHCEYIELYNKSDNDAFFEKLIYSQTYKDNISKTIDNLKIPAHAYALLSSTNSDNITYLSTYADVYPIINFSMANSYSSICLKLEDGTIIDSLRYDRSWYDANLPSKDRSLERIDVNKENDASNWTTSRAIEGCTPGKANQTSGTIIESPKEANISCDKDAITHNAREEDSKVNFLMNYPNTSFRFSIKVFDARGLILYSYSDNVLYNENAEFSWHGIDNNASFISKKMCYASITVTKDKGETDAKSFVINIW